MKTELKEIIPKAAILSFIYRRLNNIPSILIVEDELSILNLYKLLLTHFGFDVIGTAKNGEEAVQMYKSFSVKPDLIIMDHRMPIKDGIQATKEILELDENAKIILASADASIRDLALTTGALCFKLKPFDNKKLLNNINKVLAIQIERITM